MSTHDLDPFALFGGLVLVVLGAVGLLHGAGVIDSGGSWAVIGVLAAVGLAGVALSLRGLRSRDPWLVIPGGVAPDEIPEADEPVGTAAAPQTGEWDLGVETSDDEAATGDQREVEGSEETGSGLDDG